MNKDNESPRHFRQKRAEICMHSSPAPPQPPGNTVHRLAARLLRNSRTRLPDGSREYWLPGICTKPTANAFAAHTERARSLLRTRTPRTTHAAAARRRKNPCKDCARTRPQRLPPAAGSPVAGQLLLQLFPRRGNAALHRAYRQVEPLGYLAVAEAGDVQRERHAERGRQHSHRPAGST